jgi:ketosteroid isomerase-like protein
MKKHILPALASALMMTTLADHALAGAASDKAVAHFDAIAKGQVEAIIDAYADNAVLQWVGGPLDGVYSGKTDIAPVWQKFTEAQGQLTVEVSDLRENANPKGATVSANVKFMGAKTVPVRYVLTYRGDLLVNEVWQIDPNLGKY